MKLTFAVFSAALLLLLGGCIGEGNAGEKNLSVSVSGTTFEQGETASFSFSNNSSEPVFLPGCNEFSLEQFSEWTWVTLPPLKECAWEGNSIEIKSGETRQFSLENALMAEGTFMFEVTANTGCLPGKPISQSYCSGSVTITSPQFTIRKKPVAVQDSNCAVDSDCVLVDADCCGCSAGGARTAIKKSFGELYKLGLEIQCAGTACIQSISNDPSCWESATAKCIEGNCAVQARRAI